MRTAAMFLVLVLAPVSAMAQQEPLRSFEQLNRAQLLKEGATIWILSDLEGSGEYGQTRPSSSA